MMTFRQIGAVEHCSHQRAHQIYMRAIRKIRRHPETARRFSEVVAMITEIQRRKALEADSADID
jgi:hypothetical protein